MWPLGPILGKFISNVLESNIAVVSQKIQWSTKPEHLLTQLYYHTRDQLLISNCEQAAP